MTNRSDPDDASASVANPLHDLQFVEDLRRRMVRFATLQLSDPSLAEDAVQEAFIGALRGSANSR